MLNEKQPLSVKKNTGFSELYSNYEDVSDFFLDETDLDKRFYHNIYDTSQSQHQDLRVCESSN